MKDIAYIVGIDVSKHKLDIAFMTKGRMKSKVFDNTGIGHTQFGTWMLERGAYHDSTHICLKATGPLQRGSRIDAGRHGLGRQRC